MVGARFLVHVWQIHCSDIVGHCKLCAEMSDQIVYSFFCGKAVQIWARPPRFEVSRSHTIRHARTHEHTHSMTPLNEWSARRRGRYVDNTKQAQETNIHAVSGIWTKRLQTYALGRTATGVG
jgi:hypothetical protein